MRESLGSFEMLPAQRVLAGEKSLHSLVASLNGPPGILLLSERARNEECHAAVLDQITDKGWLLVERGAGEPTVESVEKVLRENAGLVGSSRFLAIGGGGAVDLAKALAALLVAPDRFEQLHSKRHVRLPLCTDFPHIIAAPTTIGSGSEVSSSAVLTGSDGLKRYMTGASMIPQTAVLDPDLVAAAPAWIRAMSLLDLLGHAIEASMSVLGNPGATLMAESAVRTVMRHARTALRTDSSADLLELQWAGHLAGIAQDRMLVGPAHVLAHYFSTIPHGLGVGWFLRAVIRVYLADGGDNRAKLHLFLDNAQTSAVELLGAIDFLLDAALTASSTSLSSLELPPSMQTLREDSAGVASPIEMSDDSLLRIWKALEL